MIDLFMMAGWDSVHFIRPMALWLLPIVITIWWIWQKLSDPLRGWRAQMDPELLEALTVGNESVTAGASRWLLVAWLTAVVAVAGPTWRPEKSPFAEDATPLMILLKADVSMDTPDPAPSRMERAHMKISDLAKIRRGQPLGLMAYAGSAHLVLPPTRDTTIVSTMAAEISSEIMPEAGDRLDLAIVAASALLEKSGQGGSLVVITDRIDTDAALLREAAGKLSSPVQFLSIQSPESSPDTTFTSVARILGGSVEPFSVDDQDIAAVIKRAAKAPTSAYGTAGNRWEESGYWLLPLLVILMLISFRREKQGDSNHGSKSTHVSNSHAA